MYFVNDAVTQATVGAYRDESSALYSAVRSVANKGRDLTVHAGDAAHTETLWYVEADTKVEDTDPNYPVIVHARTE
jgi:hypothetical protein